MQIGLQDLIEGQKVNISCFLDESRILDVTWEVVYCSKRYLLSIHSARWKWRRWWYRWNLHEAWENWRGRPEYALMEWWRLVIHKNDILVIPIVIGVAISSWVTSSLILQGFRIFVKVVVKVVWVGRLYISLIKFVILFSFSNFYEKMNLENIS